LWSQEKLVLIGGGNRPAQALEKISKWANNDQILVIGWASEEPEEYAKVLAGEFAPHFSGKLDFSNYSPASLSAQNTFLDQLANASGVFFTGGDQNKIMDTLELEGGNVLLKKLQDSYSKGIVFGGTSAGTAIMSEIMIAGDSSDEVIPLRNGLGFLSSDIIVDQHFSQRKRKRRLLSALNQAQKDIGVGIDEETAIFLTNNETYEVAGKNEVKVFTRRNASKSFHKETYRAGDIFSF